jgi:hypothetical protein
VQFERSGADSCELRSLRLHRALLLGAGHVFVWCGAVRELFFLVILGAEYLQDMNKISVPGVCRIISCILQHEKLTEVYFDHNPSTCIEHEAWQGEELPLPPSDVVAKGWAAVLEFLRKVKAADIKAARRVSGC